ncbi:MAG: hypothetical protein J0L97_08540, partial [Alphaproteobacteria bacterium]|nr:hypothetical protein [Alphaproteobacteria bacterium]
DGFEFGQAVRAQFGQRMDRLAELAWEKGEDGVIRLPKKGLSAENKNELDMMLGVQVTEETRGLRRQGYYCVHEKGTNEVGELGLGARVNAALERKAQTRFLSDAELQEEAPQQAERRSLNPMPFLRGARDQIVRVAEKALDLLAEAGPYMAMEHDPMGYYYAVRAQEQARNPQPATETQQVQPEEPMRQAHAGPGLVERFMNGAVHRAVQVIYAVGEPTLGRLAARRHGHAQDEQQVQATPVEATPEAAGRQGGLGAFGQGFREGVVNHYYRHAIERLGDRAPEDVGEAIRQAALEDVQGAILGVFKRGMAVASHISPFTPFLNLPLVGAAVRAGRHAYNHFADDEHQLEPVFKDHRPHLKILGREVKILGNEVPVPIPYWNLVAEGLITAKEVLVEGVAKPLVFAGGAIVEGLSQGVQEVRKPHAERIREQQAQKDDPSQFLVGK